MSDDEGGITQPQSTVKMMQSVAITPMPEFCPDAKLGTSLATKWNNWQSDFDMYLTASGITDPTRKRALLLYQAGPRVREIFKQIPDTGTSADYDTAKDKLKAHFDPQKNKRYEVYRFRQATQESNETLDQFHTRLRTMAETCEFTDIEFEIEEQIIIGGRSSKIRKRALRDPTFDLKAMLIEGRRDEQSTFQTKEIESKETKGGETNRLAQQHGNNISNYKSTCKNCGREFPHKGACPARGKKCNNCGKPNHFATVCRAKQDPIRIPRKTRKNKQHGHKNIRTLDTEQNSSSDEEYLYTVTDAKPDNKVNVTVGGSKFKIAVDTGATINVIDYGTFEQMKDIKLTRTNMKAYAYSKTSPVEFIGKFEAVIETKKRMSVATFFVVKAKHCGNLLSLNTAQELGLVSLHLNKLTSKDAALDHILQKHSTVFTGSGKLHGTQIKLDIDKTKVPKAQPQRRIPYHLREKVKTAIHELEKQDIIERVPDNEATPWVSPIVAVPKKDGQVRICVDMRLPNEAIRRVRHPIPTVNDISLSLNGAQYFSKLDLSQAYHQLELEEQSRYITTFSTHLGLYRYKRLNYGTNAAAEMFQYTLQTALQGLTGVKNIADDIIIFGSTRSEHDKNLDECLKRLTTKGLRLNQSKCTFLSKQLSFFGQIFTKQGTRPDSKKVNDLLNAPKPTNTHEVRSFLGMANYSSKYIRNFATITAPLRELTKKNVRFEWSATHDAAFETLKQALTSAPCMSYFDKHKDTYVTVDASPVGISAILSQKSLHGNSDHQQTIAYASRALTETEKRYSQTEKEALAIVWAVEHFHLFLFGSEFTLVTDHKPLEIIYGKRTTKTSARIERWVLRLQPYSFRIVYQAGSNNPADYLSRHPTAESCRKQEKMTEQYINFVAQHSVPKAMTLAEIIDATNSDAVLTQVKDAIRTNKWDSPAVKPFKPVKEELTTTSQGIVLRGTRIVIPAVLQQRTIDLAHQAHLGIDKTKSLIREKIWFPQIDNRVKSTIDHCLPCQAVGRPNPPEPITTTRMPKHPWTTLHVDFYGPLQTQEYLLVVIDRYSRFPEVDIVHSTKAAAVIPKLDRMFAVHGIPDVLISDNGPPFNSTDYKRYLETLGITPKFSTPLWPQGNAQAERFMQGLGKVLQTAKIQNRPWRQELSRFLLQYRTTPHSSTGVPPSELLFNRKIRGTLPVLSRNIIVNRHNEAREKESRRQEYNKSYVNNRRNTKKSNISVGDYVLVRQPKQNKLTPHFSQKPYLVIHKNKTVIKARSTDGHEIERNISHFKKIPKSNDNESDDSDDLNDYHDHETEQNARNAQIVNDNNEDQDQVRRSTRTKRVPERYGQSP